MSRKYSRILAAVMPLVGIGFVLFALNHPEMSWPWSNAVSYVLYLTYVVLMVLFFIAPFRKKMNER